MFALGVLLYELLTGQRPFEAETAGELVHHVLTTEPRRPSVVSPGVHPRLEQICLKALAKRREDRYQDVEEMRYQLAAYRRGGGAGGPGEVDRIVSSAKQYAELNKVAILIGVGIASFFYLPLILFVYLFL